MIDTEKTLNLLDAEVMTAHQWIAALIANHPNPQKVIASFQSGVESLCRNAPPGTDPEKIIELRSHAAQQVRAVELRISPT